MFFKDTHKKANISAISNCINFEKKDKVSYLEDTYIRVCGRAGGRACVRVCICLSVLSNISDLLASFDQTARTYVI